ncbi:two-component system LytT family response regulator [Lewinella marina]|uniref:DNA-binding response regulator n=1 Tax=Neolewinella marina TaxID=438751 RepID=A0A2G0CGE4_9BACT|nr:LytTR family DNA-binding domain-containing protein [Neolewinella marina]NJB86495.1 two-component system LytT family response regulator [Neolewinella marina]PHK99046.1 DNA-binding response regulator [Neolewinella marina]
MLLNAVIIEDERKGLVNLKQMLNLHCPDVEVIGDADGVASGCALFARPDIRPDVAFLDINLGDGKVFQMIERIQPIDFDIIFVTAYDHFAMKACEYSSIGYILKPIDPDRLVEAVSRVRPRQLARTDERLEVLRQYQNQPNSFEKMSIGGVDGIHFVKIRDIIRLEAEDNYTHLYLVNGQRITASKTIKLYEDMLAPFNFYRVHKRHVINMNYMKKFVKGEGGYLVMDDDMRIEVSRRRRSAFMTQLRMLQEL